MMSDALRANVESVWRQGTGQEEAPPGVWGANWRKLLSGAAPSLVMLFRGSVSARFHHLLPEYSLPSTATELSRWGLRKAGMAAPGVSRLSDKPVSDPRYRVEPRQWLSPL